MRARRQRGFTVIELVVTTGLISLVMLFAIQLLAEAGRLHGNAQIGLAEPSSDLLTQWLRRDVQGASELGHLAFRKTNEPLDLWGNMEGMLRYQRVGSNLDRVILGMQGEEIGRRTVMRGVMDWQWRAVGPGLVEVEVVYEQRTARRSRPGGGPPAEVTLMSDKHRFALRGRPRRFW